MSYFNISLWMSVAFSRKKITCWKYSPATPGSFLEVHKKVKSVSEISCTIETIFKFVMIFTKLFLLFGHGEQLETFCSFWKDISICGIFEVFYFCHTTWTYLWRCLERGTCHCRSISEKPRDPRRQWVRATPMVRTRPSSQGHYESRPQQPRPQNPSLSEQPRPQRLSHDGQVWSIRHFLTSKPKP